MKEFSQGWLHHFAEAQRNLEGKQRSSGETEATTYLDLIGSIVVKVKNTIEIGIGGDQQIVDATNIFSQILSSIFLDLNVEELSGKSKANGVERAM